MISVWDHIPTSDEVIDLRLAQGWQPTTSPLKDGPQILGSAACRFDQWTEIRQD